MKRLLDAAIAAMALVVLAPLLLLLGIAVRLDSPGPAFFRQERVGLCGRTFRIWKFRTMHVAGDGGSLITVGADRRITRLGALLRRTKLDELPQLVNVLRGEMSFVGPRPEVSRYVDLYPPAVRAEILSVRPGIIDWASIRFRNESEILGRSSHPETTYVEEILPVKQALYLDYVRNRSFMGDIKVIACYCAIVIGFSRGSPE